MTEEEARPPDEDGTIYRGRDLDCEHFGSRAEAKAYLEANPADADYLGGDRRRDRL